MDKTGTLTKGVFQVEKVENCGTLSAEELLKYAAYAEANSNHPISVSLREAYELPAADADAQSRRESQGESENRSQSARQTQRKRVIDK